MCYFLCWVCCQARILSFYKSDWRTSRHGSVGWSGEEDSEQMEGGRRKVMVEACMTWIAKEKGKGKEENSDMGKLKAGGWMSVASKVLEPPCKCCVQCGVMCMQEKNARCGPCEQSHGACTFVLKV
ncbi:uncharacterized protein EDB93DRAFT_1109174 [Suillus bovinus]|uniref:uncharacterized protein n=1 Tax=Suillus bovinus TaxID=48563 RepID=UPI001B86A6A8|nr:uncharacterized protein EDB93DRAFT_1109174 [Suillus bovinus]KAG2127648.1 hypothetical protein EDB93DRAFT_1109174 [Suillus bovinus]